MLAIGSESLVSDAVLEDASVTDGICKYSIAMEVRCLWENPQLGGKYWRFGLTIQTVRRARSGI